MILKAADYSMRRYKASIYMMHWRSPDTLQHRVLGLADPEDGMHDSSRAEEAIRLPKMSYKVADDLVGKFMKFLDDKTYLIAVSDHGNSPNRKRYPLVKALAERKVFIDLTNMYVNLKSRYFNGFIEDSEYEDVRRE